MEHVGLAALIALLLIAAISALASNPQSRAGRELAGAIGHKLACAPRLPDPCHRHPLALAYGFEVGKLVRYLAPAADPVAGVVPVDFRRCRSASCAQARDERLTTSGRLITEFTVVEDLRRGGGVVRVTYWMYRPGQRWQRIVREGGAGEVEAASSLRLRVTDAPALTPLEMVLARDQYDFPALEEPPWRGRVAGIYPG